MKQNYYIMTCLAVAAMLVFASTATNAFEVLDNNRSSSVFSGPNEASQDADVYASWKHELTKKGFQPNPNPIQGLSLNREFSEENSLKHIWGADIKVSGAESENMESRLIKLGDGSFIGTYNTGAGSKHYEGRVIKLTAEGEIEWEKSIQDIELTTVDRLCVGSDGNFYILGSSLYGSQTKCFVTSYDTEGNQRFFKVLESDEQTVTPYQIMSCNDRIAALYGKASGSTEVICNVLGHNGEELFEIREPISSYMELKAVSMGDFVVFPVYREAIIFNVKEGTVAEHPKGDMVFGNSCQTDDGMFVIYQNTTNKMLTVRKYIVENDAIAEAWTTETNMEASAYNTWLFSLRDGKVIAVNKGAYYPGLAILNGDGTIAKQRNDIDFGHDYNNQAFIYAVGEMENGDIYLFGMNHDFKIIMSKTSNDLTANGTAEYDLKDNYPYSYSYPQQSYFDGNEFVFTGWVRPENYSNHGYTTYFATWTPDAEEHLNWIDYYEPGKISRVTPSALATDSDGNVYGSVSSGPYPHLVKISPQGETLWTANISDNPVTSVFKPIILDNGNIIAGCASLAYGVTATCFSPSGKQIWTKTDTECVQTFSFNLNVVVAKGADDSMIVSLSGWSDDAEIYELFVLKFTADGELMVNKQLDISNINPTVRNAVNDNEGNVLILGQNRGLDYIEHPMIIKINSDCNVLQFITTEVYGTCPIYDAWVDANGNIFAIGNTYTNGVIFIYDNQGELKAYEANTLTSAYTAIRGTSDGTVLVASNNQTPSWTYEGNIINFDLEAQRVWESTPLSTSNGSVYFYEVYEQDGKIIVGGVLEDWSVGVSELVCALNKEDDTVETLTSSEEGGNNSYQFANVLVADNKIYIISSHQIVSSYQMGQGIQVGNVNCYAYNSGTGIEKLAPDSRETNIMVNAEIARLLSGREAVWNIYNVTGARIASATGDNISVASLSKGIYIVVADSPEGRTSIKFIKQ